MSTKAYYLNKNGSKGDSYTFDLRFGNDITPEENGNLLGIFKPQNDPPLLLVAEEEFYEN